MLLNIVKKVYRRGVVLAIRSLYFIVPILLIVHANSTACTINGQPTPPDSIKKYRKF